MEVSQNSPAFLAALKDFQRARQRAVIKRILAQLAGKSDELLAYDDVSEKLHADEPVERGLREIPLSAIVGSVNRYTDFTRTFLPRRESDKRRWAEVKAVIKNSGEIPPITVFQIDRVYFVLDGNHRVSVARELGRTHLPAYVTEIQTRVPLAPDVQPDALICKARYADFLELTRLDERRPGLDLSVTGPGQYFILEKQIDQQRRLLNRRHEDEVSYQDAAAHWYDAVYQPVVQIIRERGVLRHFPERTETDLYAWIVKHQVALKESLGWEVGPESTADDLVARFSRQRERVLSRLKKKLVDTLTPDPLEAGPPPGQWRQTQLSAHHDERLFIDTLTPLSGHAAGWQALQQALVVAAREQGRLHGLHVLRTAQEEQLALSQAIRATFHRVCGGAGVPGELSFAVGRPPRKICERSRWTDLIVIGLSHLPRPRPDDRLISGFGALVRRCARPVLAVPGAWSPLNSALLAYDGSPKANEALFVAAYLAGKWRIPLVVVTVLEEEHVAAETLAYAQTYLEARDAPATFVLERGVVARAIIRAAQLYECDFLIMGGYGFNPVMEVMLGSEVDELLRAKQWPILICR